MRSATAALTTVFALLGRAAAGSGTVWATPHDSYSSSVGVLGCKINTNRVAYWPGSIDCNNICVKLSYTDDKQQTRSVHLLRIDQSGGAHDISYDAWNYLLTGSSATSDPTAGGATAMQYEDVDADQCEDLIKSKGLPFSASNSINFIASCLAQPDSYVAKTYQLYNIADATCEYGYDEECTLDLATSNQPSCKHTLGSTSILLTQPVYNIKYPTGQVVAVNGTVVAASDVSSDANVSTTSRDNIVKNPTSIVVVLGSLLYSIVKSSK